jgi:hypothetical protein
VPERFAAFLHTLVKNMLILKRMWQNPILKGNTNLCMIDSCWYLFSLSNSENNKCHTGFI